MCLDRSRGWEWRVYLSPETCTWKDKKKGAQIFAAHAECIQPSPWGSWHRDSLERGQNHRLGRERVGPCCPHSHSSPGEGLCPEATCPHPGSTATVGFASRLPGSQARALTAAFTKPQACKSVLCLILTLRQNLYPQDES